MAETLVPWDTELATMLELQTRLQALGFTGLSLALKTIATKIPTATPKPDQFVRVMVVGGAGRDLVSDRVTLIIEGWSIHEWAAQQLCAFSVGAMQAAARDGTVQGVACYGVDVVGFPANLPHPTVTTHFRYTATISATLRRVAA